MSFRIEKLSKELEENWDNFILNDSANGTIYHTRNFLNYHPDGRFEDCSILIYDKNKIITIINVNKKGDRYFSHSGTTGGGPVIHKKYWKIKKIKEILDLIFDYYENRIDMRLMESIFSSSNLDTILYFLSQKGQIHYELSIYKDLNYNGDIISSVYRQSTRSIIRSLIKTGFTVKCATNNEDYIQYHKILESNLQKFNKKPIHSLQEFIQLRTILGDSQKLVLGIFEEEVVAGVWLIRGNQTTWHTQYIAKDYEFNNHAVIPVVLLECAEIAKAEGAAYLNFGICTEERGSFLNLGLADFKESLGAKSINRVLFVQDER